ncbi:MAG: ABC transporter permease [Flavobacteriia bacterium]|nr:ABC transporter permease [Flavobacteriia bacterium]OIP47137.1 MAG: transmembrane permease [Flavobacteriaceae bacterium CG2_30_31_66]PIV96439.1 MAG: transmembrane permease [Flavobacteriaceae bacterium CG17_big_fil_post_rev_8_21_14_2_50_31_13]PIX12319.1 MAG: transmembrane permease [Flavobacteriaceae bacterium CG_4_8_14_3_um_filter_31_8]PIY16397.1 MAG: transmembrane permease [Flavobacteriaceae bacterium CG_4_10_14_3_um_filter_31_253]PIZ11402.1 MAG: transmembrane permease [Flavobacteriaceae bac
MNFELFIAKRIISGEKYKNSISSPIIKIAVTAIALGIAIMLIAVSTAAGLQLKIRDKMAGFKGHIQIVNFDANNSDVSTTPIKKNQEFYPNFKDVTGIKNVQIFANKAGILRTETDFEGIIFKGVSTDYDWSFFEEYLVEGKVPNLNQSRNTQILLSETLVNSLQLQLNDTILATFIKSEESKLPSNRKYIISGIYNTGFAQFDKNMMIGDIKEVQNLNNWSENEIGGFEIILENFEEISIKGEQIYSEIDSTLNSKTIVEMYPSIFEWIQLFDNNVWFIIAIMILIAGINMITALLVLILERVQMIGILKALGSNNYSIQKIFLYNASTLILKGLFWGNLIGLSLIGIQHFFKVITLNPETYYVATMPVSISFLTLILLNIGTLICCFLMLIIPSFIVAKINPSKSIKFA